MKRPLSSAWIGLLVAAFVLTATGASAQNNDLSAARDLYASAAYDEALTLLNRLRAADHPPTDSRAIEQYRAFCLLALGRAADAEQAIEAVVAAEPTYHPGDGDVAPRVRAMFTDVRRRMLPTIIQQKYAQAKAAFDRRDFASAAAGFSQVLVTMAQPEVSAEVSRPPLSDIRTLAVGFEELASKAITPAAPPPVVAVPAPMPMPMAAATPPAPARIYVADDPTVVPPLAINQGLPSFRGMTPIQRVGRIEVIIDETGAVESAVMNVSVTAAYDKVALAAARQWRYTPAMVNGRPVKFRKVVQITVKPTT
jgi:TonB family protein